MNRDYNILDTDRRITKALINCLKPKGISTIIRYYGQNTTNHPEKVMTKAEANLISENHMDIVVVFEKAGNDLNYLNGTYGTRHCREAYQWAKEEIGQPSGTAIYFAADFDFGEAKYNKNIMPYFKAINEEMAALSTEYGHYYKIGAYGSGYIVNLLKNAGYCDYRWISGSIGWRDYKEDVIDASNYELLQFSPVQSLCGLSKKQFDLDSKLSPSTDIGAFRLL